MSIANLASPQAKHFQLITCMVDTLLPSTRQRKKTHTSSRRPQRVLCLFTFLNPQCGGTRITGTRVSLHSAFSLEPLALLREKPGTLSFKKISTHVSFPVSSSSFAPPHRCSGTRQKILFQFLWLASSGASLHCFQCHVVIYDRSPICRFRYYVRTYYGRRLKLFHTPPSICL